MKIFFMENTPQSLPRRFWQEVTIFTVALLILWGVLLFPYALSGACLFFILNVLAATSGILLAMSFSLSSFGYYFDFLDSKIIYRKYLGLMGYFVALIYTLMTLYYNPELYIYPFPQALFEPTVALGAVAMAIFTGMALISNQKAISFLGGKLWKTLLGFGYIAYALLVIRGILLDAPLWGSWFSNVTAPFTVRMLLTVLGILILVFRISVPFHQKYVTIKEK